MLLDTPNESYKNRQYFFFVEENKQYFFKRVLYLITKEVKFNHYFHLACCII